MSDLLLGISYGYHDSAVTLLENGKIISALQEERFSRVKHDPRFPSNALRRCLDDAQITLDDVSSIYYYENPIKKLSRITSAYFNFGLHGLKTFATDYPSWLGKKVYVKREIAKEIEKHFKGTIRIPPIEYIDHHESHAAAAYYPSPFSEAVVLCIDGVGEHASTTAWIGKGSALVKIWEIGFPHSLGLVYSAFTYYCGFKVDSGEYKLMGLAPYGKPVFYDLILNNIFDVKADGSFWVNMEYFDYAVGDCMINQRFEKLFGGPRRKPESAITNREFDLAASIQAVLEEILVRIGISLRNVTGLRNLCMSGGVALNCVANGKLQKMKIFDEIWVQPAAGDCGGSLGAALAGWYIKMNKTRLARTKDEMKGALLGTSYGDIDIDNYLRKIGARYERVGDSELYDRVAALLDKGNVIGWFQGRMEFGPRALGSRSILGDPRNPTMQSNMNLKIKNRESFRPFAPAVLEEQVKIWFSTIHSSPYMLFVVGINDIRRIYVDEKSESLTGINKLNVVRSTIPAVTHVDYSARVQTVGEDSNVRFRKMLESFFRITGCPVLINTSFNVRGEPIVESPRDAYRCFMRTNMDFLVLGNFILSKKNQPEIREDSDWRLEFALD